MIKEICKAIWDSQSAPYVSIPRRIWRDKDETWKEDVLLPKSDALDLLNTRDYTNIDAYWCPHAFKDLSKGRIKDNVCDKISFLWADLDSIDPKSLDIKPSIAWASSDKSYQAIWVLDAYYDKYEVEEINKAYNYHIGADKSGWDLTQLLRIPQTTNYKYDPPQEGKLLWCISDKYKLEDFKVATPKTTHEVDLLVLPKRAKELINATSTEGEDRSERLWELEKLLIEADIPVMQIVRIVKDTVWNKFKDRKDGNTQILTEVLKAEEEFKVAKSIEKQVKPLEFVECSSFKDFMYADLGLPEFAVKGVWQKGSVGIMAGEPKTMKSMLAIDLGLSIATTTDFLGIFNTDDGGVLYIQEEINTSDVKNRVSKISNSKGVIDTNRNFIPQLRFHVMNNIGFDITTKEHKSIIENYVKDLKIKLLILDPMYMMLGDKDENSATELRPVLQWLTSIREKYDCSVLLIHHFKKTESKRAGQRMRGSSILHAWVECGLYLEINKTIGCIKMDREFRSFKSDGTVLVNFSGVDDTYTMSVSEDGKDGKI